MNSGERLRRLIFQWPGRSISLAFPLVFLGVVVVHALTFYGFQVVYPPVSSVSPPPGEVMLITPDAPATKAFLEWVDAQSPALAPRLEEQAPEGLGRVTYEPSYTAVQTLPKPAVIERGATVFPAAREPEDLLAGSRPAPEIPGSAVETSLRFSKALATRVRKQPLPAFTQRSDGSLLPTVLLVGVGSHGRVLYAFLQESSGSAALDAEAEAVVRRQRFAPGAEKVEWGKVTFAWGHDAVSGASGTPPGEGRGK